MPKDRNKSCRGLLISAVGVSTLVLMFACLWQAVPPSLLRANAAGDGVKRQYETKRIPLIRPIDWVLAGNPTGERDLQFGEVIEPKKWRVLKLVAPKRGGGEADVEMARPLTWLYSQWQASLTPPEDIAEADENSDLVPNEEYGDGSLVAVDETQLATFDPQQLVGKTVYISVPECGIDGHAKVLAVEDCPNLKARPGPEYQLVTATFKHHGAKVVDVHVAGLTTTIGSTPNHPFWSEDKQQFVRADELKPGEHLRQADGSLTTVTAVIPRAGTHNVYNLEVHLDHVYHVANNGVLVHNGTTCPKWMDPAMIRFTQSTVSPSFDDGRTISGLIDDLRRVPGTASNSNLIIDVFEHNGQLYALNNRRLLAFQNAGVDIQIRHRNLDDLIVGKNGKSRTVREIAEDQMRRGLIDGGRTVIVAPRAEQSKARRLARDAGKIRPFSW